MAIFNKDGKVYVLESPNPLVQKQVTWEASKLIFHNFSWEETTSRAPVTEQKNTPAPHVPMPHPEPPAEKVHPLPPAKTTQSPEEKIPVQKEGSEEKREFDLPLIKHKVLSYCLPAKTETKTDKFYGESWSKVTYGRKIVFPSVMVEANDFEIKFWTSDPNEMISEKSIIYPFAYEVHNQSTGSHDRVPYDEYRWWKVTEKEKMPEGGWLFRAVPSDTQPDFSE